MSRTEVLRESRGTCPVCVQVVPARVVVHEGQVLLEKLCPEHGTQQALLSRAPDYFKELVDYYHDLMPEGLPQRDYILRLTARCNMHCPICLASSDEYAEQDLSLERLQAFLDSRRGRMKLDLMGAEPTLRRDLAEIIRLASRRGHITALHTNGIEIADPDRLRKLVEAGLREVHLQFDGFEKAHDEVLRGRPMRALRERVLDALGRFNLATDLVVTVLRGLNEDQMGLVLDLAARRPFIKEVFYLGLRRLGRATEPFASQCIAPDELIDDLERATGGRINREDIRRFQKLYFALLAAFRVRKCFYIHHYMVLRDGRGGYRPISEYLDLEYLEPRLERFRRLVRSSRPVAVAYLLFHGTAAILRRRGFPLLLDAAILNLILLFGFDLSRIRRRIILLGFISACDPWIHDVEVSANCGKGEVSWDQGVYESGADANVARERSHRTAERSGSPAGQAHPGDRK